jgi:hypothetical protein
MRAGRGRVRLRKSQTSGRAQEHDGGTEAGDGADHDQRAGGSEREGPQEIEEDGRVRNTGVMGLGGKCRERSVSQVDRGVDSFALVRLVLHVAEPHEATERAEDDHGEGGDAQHPAEAT